MGIPVAERILFQMKIQESGLEVLNRTKLDTEFTDDWIASGLISTILQEHPDKVQFTVETIPEIELYVWGNEILILIGENIAPYYIAYYLLRFH